MTYGKTLSGDIISRTEKSTSRMSEEIRMHPAQGHQGEDAGIIRYYQMEHGNMSSPDFRPYEMRDDRENGSRV
jgi:hypothetical protein